MSGFGGAFAIRGAPAPGTTTFGGTFEIEEKPPPLGDETTSQGFPFPFAAPASLTAGRMAVTRELIPDTLAVRVEPPGGAPARWAPDEALVENVFEDIKYSGEIDGGEKEMAVSLARDPRIRYPDIAPFAEATVYGAGAEVRWGPGRLDKASESDGDHKSVDVSFVGHRAALEDDKGVVLGFINSDMGAWGEPSINRRADLTKAGVDYLFSPTVSTNPQGDDGALLPPGIAVEFGSKVEGKKPIGESWFNGNGIELGAVLMDRFASLAGATENGSFDDYLFLATDDRGTVQDLSADFNQKDTSGPIMVSAAGPGRRWAGVSAQYSNKSGAFDFTNNVHGFLGLRVLGNHGLSLQGTWPSVGFTLKQMLAYAIPRFSYLEVDESELEDSEFIISQAWFSDPTTLLQIVEELTKYDVLNWFVRGRKFHLRFPGTSGRRWKLYAGPSGLKEQGLDASRLWRSIIVRWTDVDGTIRTAGPPGSGAMIPHAGLEVTDPDHPAVRAAMTRQDVLDLGGVAEVEQAIATGERWLEEANLLSRSGSCTASYYAMDDRGIMRPASQIREFDEVCFPDAHDTSYRRVTAYEYTHSTRSNSLTLDAPKASIPALLERYGARLASRGIS